MFVGAFVVLVVRLAVGMFICIVARCCLLLCVAMPLFVLVCWCVLWCCCVFALSLSSSLFSSLLFSCLVLSLPYLVLSSLRVVLGVVWCHFGSSWGLSRVIFGRLGSSKRIYKHQRYDSFGPASRAS